MTTPLEKSADVMVRIGGVGVCRADLHIISGLLSPSEGQILFDGKDVTGLKAADRNVAQVFQFPVIYSTMTAAQNLAFPLVCRKLPATKIGKRVDHVSGFLGLGDALGHPARKLTADKHNAGAQNARRFCRCR